MLIQAFQLNSSAALNNLLTAHTPTAFHSFKGS